MDYLSFIIGLFTGVAIISIAYLLFRIPKLKKEKANNPESHIRELEIKLSRTETEKDNLNNENFGLKNSIDKLNKDTIQLHRDLASKNETVKHLNERLDKQGEEIQEAQRKLQTEFKNLANEILEDR